MKKITRLALLFLIAGCVKFEVRQVVFDKNFETTIKQLSTKPQDEKNIKIFHLSEASEKLGIRHLSKEKFNYINQIEEEIEFRGSSFLGYSATNKKLENFLRKNAFSHGASEVAYYVVVNCANLYEKVEKNGDRKMLNDYMAGNYCVDANYLFAVDKEVIGEEELKKLKLSY